jgi:hypothetical protein
MINIPEKPIKRGIPLCPFCFAKGIKQVLECDSKVDDPTAKYQVCVREHGKFLREKLFDKEWYQKVLSGEITEP